MVIENNKAWDAAASVRRAWLREFFQRKTAPTGAAAFIGHAVLTGDHSLRRGFEQAHPLAVELFGVDGASMKDGDDHRVMYPGCRRAADLDRLCGGRPSRVRLRRLPRRRPPRRAAHPASISASTSASTPAASTEHTSHPTADVTIEVVLADGKVTPNGSSIMVGAGQTMMLVGSGDVKDSLHLHGYDKTLDIVPGKSTSLVFAADTKGVFELETHASDQLVAELVVS